MIQVKFHNYPDGRLEMRLAGHAGFAPAGQDIVCAAVTMLVYTAAEALQQAAERGMLSDAPVIVLRPGYALVCARPKRRCRCQVAGIFRTVRGGMDMLAKTFPQCVTVLR